MDYKEKYEQAIERAKVINPGTADYEVAVKIFPELKESEDEKIRKELKALVAWAKSYSASGITGEDAETMLAWLEKQGEQKPADNVDVLMSLDEAIEHCKEKSCGNNACALEHKQLEKWLTELKELKEQKYEWSEEDESC